MQCVTLSERVYSRITDKRGVLMHRGVSRMEPTQSLVKYLTRSGVYQIRVPEFDVSSAYLNKDDLIKYRGELRASYGFHMDFRYTISWLLTPLLQLAIVNHISRNLWTQYLLDRVSFPSDAALCFLSGFPEAYIIYDKLIDMITSSDHPMQKMILNHVNWNGNKFSPCVTFNIVKLLAPTVPFCHYVYSVNNLMVSRDIKAKIEEYKNARELTKASQALVTKAWDNVKAGTHLFLDSVKIGTELLMGDLLLPSLNAIKTIAFDNITHVSKRLVSYDENIGAYYNRYAYVNAERMITEAKTHNSTDVLNMTEERLVALQTQLDNYYTISKSRAKGKDGDLSPGDFDKHFDKWTKYAAKELNDDPISRDLLIDAYIKQNSSATRKDALDHITKEIALQKFKEADPALTYTNTELLSKIDDITQMIILYRDIQGKISADGSNNSLSASDKKCKLEQYIKNINSDGDILTLISGYSDKYIENAGFVTSNDFMLGDINTQLATKIANMTNSEAILLREMADTQQHLSDLGIYGMFKSKENHNQSMYNVINSGISDIKNIANVVPNKDNTSKLLRDMLDRVNDDNYIGVIQYAKPPEIPSDSSGSEEDDGDEKSDGDDSNKVPNAAMLALMKSKEDDAISRFFGTMDTMDVKDVNKYNPKSVKYDPTVNTTLRATDYGIVADTLLPNLDIDDLDDYMHNTNKEMVIGAYLNKHIKTTADAFLKNQFKDDASADAYVGPDNLDKDGIEKYAPELVIPDDKLKNLGAKLSDDNLAKLQTAVSVSMSNITTDMVKKALNDDSLDFVIAGNIVETYKDTIMKSNTILMDQDVDNLTTHTDYNQVSNPLQHISKYDQYVGLNKMTDTLNALDVNIANSSGDQAEKFKAMKNTLSNNYFSADAVDQVTQDYHEEIVEQQKALNSIDNLETMVEKVKNFMKKNIEKSTPEIKTTGIGGDYERVEFENIILNSLISISEYGAPIFDSKTYNYFKDCLPHLDVVSAIRHPLTTSYDHIPSELKLYIPTEYTDFIPTITEQLKYVLSGDDSIPTRDSYTWEINRSSGTSWFNPKHTLEQSYTRFIFEDKTFLSINQYELTYLMEESLKSYDSVYCAVTSVDPFLFDPSSQFFRIPNAVPTVIVVNEHHRVMIENRRPEENTIEISNSGKRLMVNLATVLKFQGIESGAPLEKYKKMVLDNPVTVCTVELRKDYFIG